jgi:hypothetical protein
VCGSKAWVTVPDPDSFEPELTPTEEAFGEALGSNRPLPGAAFRGALGRHLAAEDPGLPSRPPDLWRTVALLLAGAVVLLAIGLLLAV